MFKSKNLLNIHMQQIEM